jgi:hypothetical protein
MNEKLVSNIILACAIEMGQNYAYLRDTHRTLDAVPEGIHDAIVKNIIKSKLKQKKKLPYILIYFDDN